MISLLHHSTPPPFWDSKLETDIRNLDFHTQNRGTADLCPTRKCTSCGDRAVARQTASAGFFVSEKQKIYLKWQTTDKSWSERHLHLSRSLITSRRDSQGFPQSSTETNFLGQRRKKIGFLCSFLIIFHFSERKMSRLASACRNVLFPRLTSCRSNMSQAVSFVVRSSMSADYSSSNAQFESRHRKDNMHIGTSFGDEDVAFWAHSGLIGVSFCQGRETSLMCRSFI